LIDTVRKELRKLFSGIKVETPELENIIKFEVLKREVIEGEEAAKASTRIRKATAKVVKKVQAEPVPEAAASEV